jgi:ribosomal protein S18 acetylase RimI-like enzyme
MKQHNPNKPDSKIPELNEQQIMVRLARPADHAAIRALLPHTPGVKKPKLLEAARTDPTRPKGATADETTLVAVTNGTVIGVIHSTRWRTTSSITWLHVEPEWRRRGVGSQLLRLLEAQLGYTTWFVVEVCSQNVVGRAFLLRHGYNESEAVVDLEPRLVRLEKHRAVT